MGKLSGQTVTVRTGRFAGNTFRVEGTIEEVEQSQAPITLMSLARKGRPAAHNALMIDRYSEEDRPFYYGKIGALGYIIAEKDLEGTTP